LAKVIDQNTQAQKESVKEPKVNFWENKVHCSELCNCPDMISKECPVTTYQFLPCWEIEGTYCKLDDMGSSGSDTTICHTCRVYKKYGKNEPIKLKLFGKGMNVDIDEPAPVKK
jgi:hypothetical protein